MAGMDLPLRAIREQIASAFDLIVHLERLTDGTPQGRRSPRCRGWKATSSSCRTSSATSRPGMQDGQVQGYFTGTGIRPKFMDKIERGASTCRRPFSPPQRDAGRSKAWTNNR